MRKTFLFLFLLCILHGEEAQNPAMQNANNDGNIQLQTPQEKDIYGDVTDSLKQILSSTNGVSLKTLLQSAKNNYSIIAKNLLVQQAQKDKLVAQAGYLPRLDASYNYANSHRGDLNFQTQSAQLTLNFNIFKGFGDQNNVRQKDALLNVQVSDNKYTQEQLYLQIIQTYYTYFSNKSALDSLIQKHTQMLSDLKRVQSMYKQGLKTIDDVESLKSQASLTEYQINDAQLSVEQSLLDLEFLTNSEIKNLSRVVLKDPTYKLQQRADIKSLGYTIDSYRFLNKQLNYYPQVDFQNTYTYNIQLPNYVQASLLTNPIYAANFAKNQNQMTITVTYNLFDKIGLSLQKQSYKLQELSNVQTLSYKKDEQKRDEKLYRLSISLAKSQINSAKQSLTSANISFENVRKKYNSNLITFADYLLALSTKYDAESTYIKSLNNYEIQKANYIFYSGQDLESYIND